MSLQETIVSAWYMLCTICDDKSTCFLSPKEALTSLKSSGWINKSYYKDNLSYEDWYCPKCAEKASETKDTLPPEAMVEDA